MNDAQRRVIRWSRRYILGYLLFPFTWLAYKMNRVERRGALLESYRVNIEGRDATLYFGLCPGLRAGHLYLQAVPPIISVKRNDSGTMIFDLEHNQQVKFYVNSDFEFVISRDKLGDFVVCGMQPHHALQLLYVRAQWPNSIKERFNFMMSAQNEY